MKARDDGLNELDCMSLYPKCDESELHKMQYTYWIMPWNPMGNGNLLFKFLNWAFNKQNLFHRIHRFHVLRMYNIYIFNNLFLDKNSLLCLTKIDQIARG